jgi:hypothetical protein
VFFKENIFVKENEKKIEIFEEFFFSKWNPKIYGE